ncbi:hypothetical protein HOD20_10215 [archaeon]|jgi:hypothetical protein|nr:hypothetical protein [Candidatus Woesearchaeota archaeon]MBT3464829.1 hypothetical protein [archaeon]MBT4352884.1 hypothetical protein [archaeon]MBT4647433.1 hypothetical protein [archaeon]MBT6821287.1 hypothetical protein [archaeon]
MKRIYLKAAIIHEFLKGNDSLETMIFCNNDKIKFVTTDQSLYEAMGSLKNRDIDMNKLIKLAEVTEIMPFKILMQSERKILTNDRVDEIRDFEFDEKKFNNYLDKAIED